MSNVENLNILKQTEDSNETFDSPKTKEKDYQKWKLKFNQKAYYRLSKWLEGEDPNNPEAQETFRIQELYKRRATDAYRELNWTQSNKTEQQDLNPVAKDLLWEDIYNRIIENLEWEKMKSSFLNIETQDDYDKFLDNFSSVLVWKLTKPEDIAKELEKYKNSTSSIWKAIENFFKSLFWKNDDNWNIDYGYSLWELPEGIDSMSPTAEKVLRIAMGQKWISEFSWQADKYFSELWFDYTANERLQNSQPWCAAFVSWTLKKAWVEWIPSNPLLAQAYIWWTWKWHIWFKVWNQVLWGNQSDIVSLVNNRRVPAWYREVENWSLSEVKYERNFSKIPDWAIVIYANRQKSES